MKGQKITTKEDYQRIFNLFLKATARVQDLDGAGVTLVCSGNVVGCKKAFPEPWGPLKIKQIPEKK